MKKKIKEIVHGIAGPKVYFRIKSLYADRRLRKENYDLYMKIKQNNQYKDIHKVQRCFILGNGPSLGDVDLQSLKDEILFTVNFFSKTKEFEKVDMKYHFWIDPAFFELRDDMHYNTSDIMENYQKISEKGAECFVPSFAYGYMAEKGLDKKLKINYLNIGETIENSENVNIDISRMIPSFTTVVQYAICTAIYMGFEEIYLLGCDTTNVVGMINSALEKPVSSMHAYDNDNSDNINKELLGSWKMSEVFYDQYILFRGYRILYDYCSNQGIKLANCSTTTLINEIPKKNIEEILC